MWDCALHLSAPSINDEILDKEELAAELIKNMSGRYGKRLEERYGVTLVENTAGDGEDTKKAWEILREIARARSCLLKGSELDTKKAAAFLLDDFRSGKLGRVTLEVPVPPEASTVLAAEAEIAREAIMQTARMRETIFLVFFIVMTPLIKISVES